METQKAPYIRYKEYLQCCNEAERSILTYNHQQLYRMVQPLSLLSSENSALHVAFSKLRMSRRFLQFLFDIGYGLSSVDIYDNSLLHLATKGEQNRKVLSFLLDAGICVNSVNMWGNNALVTLSLQKSPLPRLKLLVEHGGVLQSNLIYYRAAYSGRIDHIIRWLAYKGVNINYRDPFAQQTALHARMKSPTATVSEIIMMVSLGANLAIKDSTGKTPLDILRSRGLWPCRFECTRIKYNDDDCPVSKGLPHESTKVEKLLARVSYNWYCHTREILLTFLRAATKTTLCQRNSIADALLETKWLDSSAFHILKSVCLLGSII
ncbi:uncharacterized protein OCT59_002906 [Rhizophagus irregularis]|nr:hypothetical protein OCT59_002906 [Rhizophagus irregularis]GBC36630.1 ankyrin repeat protein [Rhizophagus irregularis DAOM 181602=DAOM 197198]